MGFFLDVLRLKYSFFIGNCEIVAKNIFAVFAPRIAKMKKKTRKFSVLQCETQVKMNCHNIHANCEFRIALCIFLANGDVDLVYTCQSRCIHFSTSVSQSQVLVIIFTNTFELYVLLHQQKKKVDRNFLLLLRGMEQGM